MGDWESVYSQNETVWGDKPDHALAELTPHLPPGRVLDLGMGEGRNAIFFAVNGFDVRGVDIAPSAVERCRSTVQMLGVAMRAEVADFKTIDIEPDAYALIICALSVQFAKQSESAPLLERIARGIMPGGWVYITTFSTEDPSLARFRESGQTEVEPRTYYSERRGGHIHFFERDELMAPFAAFRLHEVSQTITYDPGHPGVPEPHYHGFLAYIGQKPA